MSLILSVSQFVKVHHISEISIDDQRKYAYLGSPYNLGIWRIKVEDLDLK
jgi:hypothetical protein